MRSTHLSRVASGRAGLALRSLMACAASFDRKSVSRHLPLLGVDVEGRRCSDLMEQIRPHILRAHNIRPVREGSDSDRRLVLLDESLQDEDALPLPLRRAVDAVEGRLQRFDIHLGYDDLPAREVLRQLLPANVTVPAAYESVGHVVHLNLRPEQLPYRHLIGQVLLDKLRPRIRTVANKATEIHTVYRSIPLELIAGDDDYDVHVQHGDAKLSFDYSKVYWSSRLHTEHERMANSFAPGDVVWDLFAGVGPFAVLAGRRGTTVLANDLNPDACAAMLRNVQQNRVLRQVHVYNLDAAAFVRAAVESVAQREPGLGAARLAAQALAPHEDVAVASSARAAEARLPDHVLLNLPADSLRFLEALSALREVGASPRVHCYSFSKLEEATERLREARERVAHGLGFEPAELTVREVRSVAPGKEMLCYSFWLTDVGS